jgi:hypothetical protein
VARSIVATAFAGSAALPVKGAARRVARFMEGSAQLPIKILFFLVLFYIAACMVGAAIYGLASGRSSGGAIANSQPRS